MPLLDASSEVDAGSLHASAFLTPSSPEAELWETMGLNGVERVECGNVACRTMWTPPWRSRQHPLFEGKWACSSRCALAMVRSAIARESEGRSAGGMVEQHNHRVPLGLVLLAQGWITHAQLQRALESQRMTGRGKIGDWLVEQCGLESEFVTRGLSVQWSCPVLTTDGFSPEAMAFALPRVFVEEYGILPLRIVGSKILYVGFEDHLDASSAFAVERMTGFRTESGLVGEARFRRARQTLLACRFTHLIRSTVPDRDMLALQIARVIQQRQPAASRLVRLHGYYWLRIWTDKKAPSQKRPDLRSMDDFLFTIGMES